MKYNLRDIINAVPSRLGCSSVTNSYPCTPNQERYLLASLGGSQSYYLPLTFVLPSEVSVSRLRHSVERIITETPALGAAFSHLGIGRFTWHPVGVRALGIRQVSVHSEIEAVGDATAFIHGGPGPLKEPPCKLHIARLPTGSHLLTLALHHAVADAVSLGLVVDRISDNYTIRHHSRILGSFTTATKNDDLGQHGGLAFENGIERSDQSDRTYWQHALANAAAAGPLPLLKPSSNGEATTRDEVIKRLGPDALRRLTAAARAAGVTTFEATFAAYLLVLSRQTGRSASCATFQSSGRRAHPERENVIGVFSNALPVLAVPNPDKSFADHARVVRCAVRASLRHETLPYHEIIRETGVHPRFGINWYPGLETLDLDGFRIPGDRRVGWQSDFDLNFHILQTEGRLDLSLSYPVKRLHAWRAEIVLDHITALLSSDILNDVRPIRDISLSGTHPAVVTSAIRTREPEPDTSISARVAQIAKEDPERTAIVASTGTLSYNVLKHDVDILAEALIARGAGPGNALAIELPRGLATATAILAADRVGAVFAVYDPDYPPNRRCAMDNALRPILRLRAAASEFATAYRSDPDAGRGNGTHHKDRDMGSPSVINLASGALVLLNTGIETPLVPLPGAARYALFTSGTTGRPKCVLADGRGLCRFLERTRMDRAITADDRFALLGGLGHDPMLRDVLLPLTSGAMLHVPSEDTRRDPYALFEWLSSVRPTMLHLTPQLARFLAFGARGRTLPTLRHATFGGDMLTADAIAVFQAIAPKAAISNLYGATETPQAASLYDLAPGEMEDQESGDGKAAARHWDICPVGHSAGSRRLVLEFDGRAAAIGEPAEIVVEGDDLALGYYDAADDKVQLGRGSTGLPLRHRTGDLGLRMPSGDVLVLGRADDQVKIRGFRVEPAEVSRHLESRADIAQALTIARPGADGETELVAYAVAKTGSGTVGTDTPVNSEMLLESCRQNLPAAMVPRVVVLLDRLPLTANGKIDRAALPDPDSILKQDLLNERGVNGSSQTHRSDRSGMITPEAAALAGAVADVLGRASVSPTSCVRDLGVDSLSYLSVSLALEARLGSLPRQWDTLPLSSLAELGAASSNNTESGLQSAEWFRHIRLVETPVLMRAVSIAAVVAGHFGLIAYGGATSALFFIAGHSFGRFQIPAVLRQNSIVPILNLVALIVIPTILYSILIQTAFAKPEPLTLLMLGNLLGPNAVGGLTYWFVDVLVQCLLVLAAVLAFPPVRQAIRERPFECACFSVCASVFICYAIGAVWNTDYLYDRVVHEKLWIFTLGWCLAQAISRLQRILATLLTLAVLSLNFVMVDGAPQFLTALAFIVILAVPRLPFPKIAAIPITRVAAASLFIYLTHFQFRSVAKYLPEPLNLNLLAFIIALVGGVILHRIWDRIYLIWRKNSHRFGFKEERIDSMAVNKTEPEESTF
ncbi:AMP-binding protein [Paracoccus actinidiae]|uniref:AMP-binding protein n=1 Tax=Paracoccus actinidiae TaxID=3064531 RepID=UPI0027D2056A|nr:AMP-binding protein [Paracoccus sp. M09]